MVVPSVGFDINKAAKSDPALAKQIISIPDSELYLVANDLTADKYEKKNKKHQKAGTAQEYLLHMVFQQH